MMPQILAPIMRCAEQYVGPAARPSDRVRAARTAAAGNRAVADDGVVVGQLFAALDRARGLDPDRLVDDLERAVRRAGVVDEPRDVAADVGVAAPRAVDLEDPGAAVGEVARLARFAYL